MKFSNGTAGVVALVVAALGLVGIVAADQMMRQRAAKSPPPPARTIQTTPAREPAPKDTLHLTPPEEGMPPPGETLTI